MKRNFQETNHMQQKTPQTHWVFFVFFGIQGKKEDAGVHYVSAALFSFILLCEWWFVCKRECVHARHEFDPFYIVKNTACSVRAVSNTHCAFSPWEIWGKVTCGLASFGLASPSEGVGCNPQWCIYSAFPSHVAAFFPSFLSSIPRLVLAYPWPSVQVMKQCRIILLTFVGWIAAAHRNTVSIFFWMRVMLRISLVHMCKAYV